MTKLLDALLIVIVCSAIISCTGDKNGIEYSVPNEPWEEAYGNHRAVLQIDEAAEAVELNLEWRRHDKDPHDKRFLIINAETGDTIPNIFRKEVNNERCNIVFGPVNNPGKYYFYYLPYAVQEGYGFFYKGHFIPEDDPKKEWVEANNLNSTTLPTILPLAKCSSIQARTEFDSFFPMEIIATQEEKQKLILDHPKDFYLFPEDRKYPIRMQDNIPQKWIEVGLTSNFKGKALLNEYYVLQVGLWAPKNELENVSVEFSDLENGSSVITKDRLTCFNVEGTDPDGKYFQKNLNVSKGNLQALWIGIDIPKDIEPGKYNGKISIKTSNKGGQDLTIGLQIRDEIIEDRGDSELWRHSRLRWLNSTAGIDRENVKPYKSIDYKAEDELKLSGSEINLSGNGLPRSIRAYGTEILASQISLYIKSSLSDITAELYNKTADNKNTGEASSEYLAENKELSVRGVSSIESDGYLSYKYTIKAKENIKLKDVKLRIPLKKEIAEYMMGMGLPGTKVPVNHSSKWEGPHDSFWIGNTYGGIHCELKGSSYHGPLLNLYKPQAPDSWHNEGKGGFSISRIGNTVSAEVSSGERSIKEGEEISFEFALIITPIHQIDTHGQFTQRYYHNGGDPSPDEAELESGVEIINLHHANDFNPHINYPFIAREEMKGFIDKYHEKDKKVKIYYTIRELTNWVTEIWALRSLGDEIIGGGNGGGFPWLKEHFIDDYTPQWYQRLDSTKVDASVLTSTGESRWFNYYIEGLGWLVENMDIDGLYLDDVSFDRRMLKRMRKVMEEHKPNCIIDLHSNTGFSKGPATQYTDFFPYVDKLWFGESFQYDEMPPENWLVEVSGIPFGLMGDMLHGGGNPWRGMVYGMTVRYPWTTEGVACNPRDIWEVWDNFDIASAEMIGYWDKKSEIRTNQKDVLLTYYQKADKILISVASWSDKTENIRIIADWKALGFDPNTTKLSAPGIKNFQPESEFKLEDLIPIEPKKGWIFILSSQ